MYLPVCLSIFLYLSIYLSRFSMQETSHNASLPIRSVIRAIGNSIIMSIRPANRPSMAKQTKWQSYLSARQKQCEPFKLATL